MQDLAPGSVDMVLCDLPYGTTACKWDTIIPFEPLWAQYRRVVKANGAIVLFSAQPFTTALIHSNLKQYRYNWYWRKNNATGGIFCKYQPMRCIEDICVFYRRMPTYNPQGLTALERPIVNKPVRSQTTREKKTSSVQRFTGYPKHLLEFPGVNVSSQKRVHPTQKPVDLLAYLIKTYTGPGDVVLDNCMGSGSTGVACVNTGRRFIGMEMDGEYFNVARQRIDDAAFSIEKAR